MKRAPPASKPSSRSAWRTSQLRRWEAFYVVLPKIQASLFLCSRCSRSTCVRQPACPSSPLQALTFYKQSEPLPGGSTLPATAELYERGVCVARWPTTPLEEVGPSEALKPISLSPGTQTPPALRSLWKCAVAFCLQHFP